jgi:hypothetical protein
MGHTFKIINIIVLFLSIGLGLEANAQIDHASFTKILQKNVSEDGFVDYQNLKKEEQKLDTYLNLLEKNTPSPSWTRNEKMAYLINTYNAYTLKLILKNYPIESIKDIEGVFSSPFGEEFIPFNGEAISLDDVEKGMLLKMAEPRVHFAVNCASESCPKLNNSAFEAKNLDRQLNEATKAFINSKENEISMDKLKLSKIFKWYASDFEATAGSVIQFINPYTDKQISTDADVSYKDYSWKLNGK